MRVVAGKCRSLVLRTPKGEGTRPTLDRIKETLFNIIQSEVPGAVFLDLFAGSGGIGTEALSRGARKAYFLEKDKEACECIAYNLNHCNLADDGILLKGDVFARLSDINEKSVDIIFIDPPYESGCENKLFDIFLKKDFITDDTLIILEAALKKDFDFEGFSLVKEKRYKTNKHLFYKKTV